MTARHPGRVGPPMHMDSVTGAGITTEQLQAWRARFGAFENAA
jgi:hypothetical protein